MPPSASRVSHRPPAESRAGPGSTCPGMSGDVLSPGKGKQEGKARSGEEVLRKEWGPLGGLPG